MANTCSNVRNLHSNPFPCVVAVSFPRAGDGHTDLDPFATLTIFNLNENSSFFWVTLIFCYASTFVNFYFINRHYSMSLSLDAFSRLVACLLSCRAH